MSTTFRELIGRSGRQWKNRARNIRKTARECLPELVAQQFGECLDCRLPIIDPRRVPPDHVLFDDDPFLVVWHDPSQGMRVSLRATVEHLKPIREELDETAVNDPENLAACCLYCNQGRDGGDVPRPQKPTVLRRKSCRTSR